MNCGAHVPGNRTRRIWWQFLPHLAQLVSCRQVLVSSVKWKQSFNTTCITSYITSIIAAYGPQRSLLGLGEYSQIDPWPGQIEDKPFEVPDRMIKDKQRRNKIKEYWFDPRGVYKFFTAAPPPQTESIDERLISNIDHEVLRRHHANVETWNLFKRFPRLIFDYVSAQPHCMFYCSYWMMIKVHLFLIFSCLFCSPRLQLCQISIDSLMS